MAHLRSTGIEDPQDSIYGVGMCHIHAMACAIVHESGPPSFLVMEDHALPVWTNEADPDDYIPAIVHVYSLHETPAGLVARDVVGDRLASEAAEEAEWLYGNPEMISSTWSLSDLISMTQGHESPGLVADDCENPLIAVTEDLLRQATREETVTAAFIVPAEEATP